MRCQRATNGQPTACPWDAHTLCVGCPWAALEASMDGPLPVECPWAAHEMSMDCPGDFLSAAHGVPTACP